MVHCTGKMLGLEDLSSRALLCKAVGSSHRGSVLNAQKHHILMTINMTVAYGIELVSPSPSFISFGLKRSLMRA